MAGWRLAGVVAAADGAHASRTAFTESDGDAAPAGKRRKIYISGERLEAARRADIPKRTDT
eukprot:ctg_2816.g780